MIFVVRIEKHLVILSDIITNVLWVEVVLKREKKLWDKHGLNKLSSYDLRWTN